MLYAREMLGTPTDQKKGERAQRGLLRGMATPRQPLLQYINRTRHSVSQPSSIAIKKLIARSPHERKKTPLSRGFNNALTRHTRARMLASCGSILHPVSDILCSVIHLVRCSLCGVLC